MRKPNHDPGEGKSPNDKGSERIPPEPKPSDAEAPTASVSGTQKRGEWIAGYRIIRKLGQGGMGIVYEAEQQSPRRAVALKVIRGGPYVEEHQVKLFQREAQTLARLRHPAIAAIHEAGRTEEGQHFFAMELVRGHPLDEYLRSHPLKGPGARARIRARLHLFLKICDAINYAHQRGVIHRDLKPSNILIMTETSGSGDPAPRVKILDFGLARITDSDVAVTTVVTEAGKIQGTLTYMSPEQARGNPDEIDLRSDVYSLGVILYELLTDGLPYEVNRSMLHEAVRVICEESPRKPTAVSRTLRGDLETITLKALEKEPGRRYQSALALGEDIERHLSDQPILARPPSAAYQLRKLVARHRGPFAFAVMLFVLLAAFGVTMSVMFEIQRREKSRAEGEARKAERINEFFQRMLSSVRPAEKGREVTVREVLDEAAAEIETGLEDQPLVQAAAQSTIGTSYLALGLYESAEAHLEDALETRRRLLGERHPVIASSLKDLASLRFWMNDYDDGERLLLEAVDIRKESFGPDDPGLVELLVLLGRNYQDQGRFTDAKSALTEALTIEERSFANEPRDVTATLLQGLGMLHRNEGAYAEAGSLYLRALEVNRSIFGDEHLVVAESQVSYAKALEYQGKYSEAEAHAREALGRFRVIHGVEHEDVAASSNVLAIILMKQGRYDEAEELYREALDIREAVFGEVHLATAQSFNNLANLKRRQGKQAEGETYLRKALSIWRQVLGEEHPFVATGLNNLARNLFDQGKYGESESLFLQTLAMRRRLLGDEHPHVATTMSDLAVLYSFEERYDEAEPLMRDGLAVFEETLGEDHPDLVETCNDLALILRCTGELAEAESLLRRSLDLQYRHEGAQPEQIAKTLRELGSVLLHLGKVTEAERRLKEGLEILGTVDLPDAAQVALLENGLGSVLAQRGDAVEAESLLVKSVTVIRNTPKIHPCETRLALDRVADFFRVSGRLEEAKRYRSAR